MTQPMAVPGYAVNLRGIGKVYRSRRALSRVDLDLATGQVVGFVGPNGAGKTTLLKIIAGLARPTEGEGQVLGLRIAPHEMPTPLVGMMIEKPVFIEHLTAVKNLEMLAAIRARIERSEIEAALLATGLDPSDRRPVRAFSQGMRQRLSLAQATMEAPRLLLLDEPTNGLDPRGLVEMRGMIRALAERGATVLLASHLLSEVEAVCDRVVVVDGGRIVRDFGPNPTSEPIREIVLEVSAEADLAIVAAMPGFASSTPVGGRRVRLLTEDAVPVIVRALVRAGVGVESIHPASQTLEDAYLAAVGTAGEC